MKTQVKSTKELRTLFPELPITNKFKRKIDELFLRGFVFDIYLCENWKCYTAKSGKHFKAKIGYKQSAYLFNKTSVIDTFATLDSINTNPDLYHDVATVSTAKYKTNGGDWIDQYRCLKESTDGVSWAQLCNFMGKLVKSELVHVEKCHKCNGTGFIPEFAWYADGICFDCMGMGSWFEVSDVSK